jgi:hypothetical protein
VGSYSRLIDCLYHSTLGSRVIKEKKRRPPPHVEIPVHSSGNVFFCYNMATGKYFVMFTIFFFFLINLKPLKQ